MKLYVGSRVLTLEVEPTETVADVTRRVRELEGRETPYSLEGMAYGGKILQATDTLVACAIPPDATLFQVKRGFRGGGPTPSPDRHANATDKQAPS
jgi:hypothetical protein